MLMQWSRERQESFLHLRTGTLHRIDDYAFDTDALLISGNGANVGVLSIYYKGKFNAVTSAPIKRRFGSANDSILHDIL